jgi:hypothetical protein
MEARRLGLQSLAQRQISNLRFEASGPGLFAICGGKRNLPSARKAAKSGQKTVCIPKNLFLIQQPAITFDELFVL